MDRLSAPQQNRMLGGIADLLRKIEQDSGPEFLPRGLDVMGLVRQLALPSAETVEKLSYGDPFFRIPTQSNIPITTDKGYLAEVLGMAPIVPAASRATTRISNEVADQLVKAITKNPEATAPRALQAAGEMAPLSRVIFPYNKEQIKKIDEEILSAKVPENMYFHGTDKDFKNFRRKDRGLAYYFTPDPMQAASYSGMDVGANIRPVKLDIKKTYRGGDIDEIMEVVKNEGDYYPYTISKMREFLETQDPKAFHTPSVIKALKKRGYDSFVEYEDGVEQIGVFSNKNIKPAFEQQKTLDTLTTPGLLEPQAGAKGFNVVQPGDKVSGLTVREDVPNMSSISASLDDYEILSGIREVPRSAFDPEYLGSLSYDKLDKRTKDLAEQIRQSKEINPMIVGVDSKGAYIIEGGHRFDALMSQDTKSIPAVVVIDKSDPPANIGSLLD